MSNRVRGRSQSLEQQISSTVGGNQSGANLPPRSQSLERQIANSVANTPGVNVTPPGTPTSVDQLPHRPTGSQDVGQ